MVNSVLAVFWNIGTNPDGIDLLNILIAAVLELCAILRGNQAGTVINGTFHKGISWIVVVLRFDIQNQPDAVMCIRSNGKETNIVKNGSFGECGIFCIQPTNRRSSVVRMDADAADYRLTLNLLLLDIKERGMCKFPDAGF